MGLMIACFLIAFLIPDYILGLSTLKFRYILHILGYCGAVWFVVDIVVAFFNVLNSKLKKENSEVERVKDAGAENIKPTLSKMSQGKCFTCLKPVINGICSSCGRRFK